MRRSRLALIVWAISIAIVRPSTAQLPSDADHLEFFESKVRPLLAEHCFECHGARKQENGLRLDRPKDILAGGDSGNTIVAGQPEQSLLWVAVSGSEPSLRMPPTPMPRLEPSQIAILTNWIRNGAAVPIAEKEASPRTTVTARSISSNHWAFQSPKWPRLPDVADIHWPRTPIDRFILASLEREGMRPSPDSDRATWLRRVTFDLVGLPPSVDEQLAFESDLNEVAFERVVDRLLASPEYGRRFGRHWLDVARYADSNGLDENIAHGNAWRYRNYVIDSLNADKPFDQFILEQIAGDLLPVDTMAQRHEQLIATGFLSLGPKVLAEVDEKKMEMDIVDEQIDTLSKAMMAMTFGCARCHDHKFDPVSSEDYYALAGVFKSTKTMDSFTKIAKWHENSLAWPEDDARKAAHDARIVAAKSEIESIRAAAIEQLKASTLGDPPIPKEPESLFADEVKMNLKSLRDALAKLEKSGPEMPAAMGAIESTATDVPIHVRGSHLALGKLVARRFPAILDKRSVSLPSTSSGRLELGQWLIEPEHPLTARVIVNRIWRWHFGKGLVTTTDNFGLMGQLPSHPELLDWLTLEFIRDDWSLKSLHRNIVLSSVYRQSSRGAATGHHDTGARSSGSFRDSENALLSYFPLRRLEAEAIRDSILEVAGKLDHSQGTSLLHVKNREFLFDHTSIDKTNYNSPLRSVYLPVIRNNLYDVFQLFDYSDAAMVSGNRESTTVSSQALFVLNSRMLHQAAAEVAGQELARQLDESSHVRAGLESIFQRSCMRILGRRANTLEEKSAQQFVEEAIESGDTFEKAWSQICHGLMASNEFIYLR